MLVTRTDHKAHSDSILTHWLSSEPAFSQFGSPAFEHGQLWLLQSCFCPGVTTAAQQQALFAPGCPPVVARVVQAGRQQCWERRNCPTKAADIARAIAVALAVPSPLAPQLSASPTLACLPPTTHPFFSSAAPPFTVATRSAASAASTV